MHLTHALRYLRPPVPGPRLADGSVSQDERVDGYTTLRECDGQIERLDFKRGQLDPEVNPEEVARLRGLVSMWKCARHLIHAANLLGPDELPDVRPPRFQTESPWLMGQAWEAWGKQVYGEALERVGEPNYDEEEVLA